MGGLFSRGSNQKIQDITPHSQLSYRNAENATNNYNQYYSTNQKIILPSRTSSYQQIPWNSTTRNIAYGERITQGYNRIGVSKPKPLPSLGPLTKQVKSLMKRTRELSIGRSFNLTTLDESESEFIQIKNKFMNTTQRHYKVNKIERIENPFLYGCYLLKKQELKIRFGLVYEIYVFHGTRARNISKICENNLDWRLHGINKGNKFGKGVSFSEISNYSSHYRDSDMGINVMFYVKMIYSHMVPGDSQDILPKKINKGLKIIQPDTSYKDKITNGGLKQVLVKYSDYEFYPAYIIHYSGEIIYPQRHFHYY